MPEIKNNKTALQDFYDSLDGKSSWQKLSDQEKESFKKFKTWLCDVKGSYKDRMVVYSLCYNAFMRGLKFKPTLTKNDYIALKKVYGNQGDGNA